MTNKADLAADAAMSTELVRIAMRLTGTEAALLRATLAKVYQEGICEGIAQVQVQFDKAFKTAKESV